ncbi:hypothetical protein [Xylocopilactobacillus apicola]|uniref:Uncharacterized protein n=1 Tax=Xylocopilactobacillus apicola TaxID=2932184 RepID=A0AAU9DC54_9LACO|nr:hypothetical protein [Xylocopilactobacillus apicola]BDR59140.1 hypothetical protein XA3_15810 [Xylocopilactobacillus apicola]
MKRKIIRYPIQVAIALTWLMLGAAWLLRHHLLPGLLFVGAGVVMLMDSIKGKTVK